MYKAQYLVSRYRKLCLPQSENHIVRLAFVQSSLHVGVLKHYHLKTDSTRHRKVQRRLALGSHCLPYPNHHCPVNPTASPVCLHSHPLLIHSMSPIFQVDNVCVLRRRQRILPYRSNSRRPSVLCCGGKNLEQSSVISDVISDTVEI